MTSPSARIDQSYRGLLRVPQLSRVLASMMLARVGNAMVGVAIVLFTLEAYDSPALAGLVTLAYILPGILVSPIAGALLDRHGRVRLIILDYIVSGSTLGLIALLALADNLPAGLLVLIAALASLTSILSATGLRSLFPIMVPKQLWERVNAVDSNGYIVATILGPPIAAALVTVVGGPPTLAIIGGLMLLATIPLIGVRDPAAPKPAEAPLLREAWDGVLYVWHNPTLRGLAFSISTLNIAGGVASIAIPLLVLRQLGLQPGAGRARIRRVGHHRDGLVGLLRTVRHPRPRVADARGPHGPHDPDRRAAAAGRGLGAGRHRGRHRAARRDRAGDRLAGALRHPERAARHRAVHRPPAPDRPGDHGPRVRGLDGGQLRRLPAGFRDRRPARQRRPSRPRSGWGSPRASSPQSSRPC